MKTKSQKLINPTYLSFPFRVSDTGATISFREQHIKEQIEQVLFTNPQERIFQPYFGAGIRSQIFEPNSNDLWSLVQKRLLTTLADALEGEVDPKTIDVDVRGDNGNLLVTIMYKLATINRTEQHEVLIPGAISG